MIESFDPITLPLYAVAIYAAAMYPIGLILGSECSLCCCPKCTGCDCCGEEYARPVGFCCEGEWRLPDAGSCCGGEFRTTEEGAGGGCCDDVWYTTGTCCKVPTVQLAFSSNFGGVGTCDALARGKMILTDGETTITAILQHGGAGYARVVDDVVEVATVTVISLNSSSGTSATMSATIDDDPESETFGAITALTVDNPGSGYDQWVTQLQDHLFTGEGACCGNDWRTGEGSCCNKVWFPEDNPCPAGQVFVDKGEDCCGCFPETVFDPESEEMVSTVENPSLVEVLTCDSSCVLYARFDDAGTNRGSIGRCCLPGGVCQHEYEDDCDALGGTWEEKCCPDLPQCEVACCRENDDGVASCDVGPKNECELPDIIDGGDADCETACKGACCVDGSSIGMTTQEECDEADGCWAGIGQESCRATDECRPPFTTNCCESVVSDASGLTFTQPRRKRCEPTVRPWLVTVTGTTDSEIMIHGVPVGQTATPTKRCPISVAFLVCWDKFNIEPMPCNSEFRRLDVTVCWTPAESSAAYQELLNYSGCSDITLWLGDCSRDCETTLTYDGPGVTSTATFQIRGDATIEANGGALVLPAFTYAAACDITLTLAGTSTAANAVPAMANPDLSSTLSLKKDGSGWWKLTAASTFTGATEIIGGTLIVATNAPSDGNGAFGFSLNGGVGGGSSPIVTLAGGAALLLDAGAQVGRIIDITGGSGLATVGGVNTSGTTRFQSTMTFFVNQDVLIQAASGGTVEFANGWLGGAFGNAGPVEGDFTFGSGGNTGTVLLSGNLSTNGAVGIEYGTLRVTGSIVAVSGVTVAGSGAVLDYRGTVDLASPVSLAQGTLTGDGKINTVAAPGSATILVGTGDEIEIDTELSGSGTLTKTGTGTLVITGTSPFSGTLNVTAGTLEISNGGTFDGTLAVSAGTLTGNTTLGAVAVSNSPTVLVETGDEIEIGGALSGSGTLAKTGAGTLRITGSTSFSGTLNVSAGNVVVGQIPTNPGGLATSATFTSAALTVAFTADPTSGAQYVLLAGPTTQTYTPTLTGTTKTATYNAATATLTIT